MNYIGIRILHLISIFTLKVDFSSDYHGASKAGVHALLLRRPGPDGEGEQKEEGEDLTGIKVIRGLREVVEWTR